MVALRRTIVTATVIVLLAVAAPRVGEPDRSEGRAISTISVFMSQMGSAQASAVAAMRDHDGYHFEFHEYPDEAAEQGARSTRSSFTVVAVPTKVGPPRRRAFCADDRGIIYVTEPMGTPPVEGGRCVDTSRPLGR
jgi:hypothetical protein